MISATAESKETSATKCQTKDAYCSIINERNVSFIENFQWKEDRQEAVSNAAKAHRDLKSMHMPSMSCSAKNT